MKKVLIICYYWPPAGGPGVQRWLNFVKYLPDFGFEPVVFAPKNPSYPIEDQSLLAQVPPELQLVYHPIFEPYGLASFFSKKKTKRISSGIIQETNRQSILERVLLWVRGNLFVPDARKFWVRPAAQRLRKLLEAQEIQYMITTGPPHSVHLIGLRLKRQLGLNWYADFRDPWTSIGYHKKLKLTKRVYNKHKMLEKKVLNAADAIITTSTTTQKEFSRLTSRPIEVITNGYDSANETGQSLDHQFSISHIGSLLTDRNPVMLWEVLEELTREISGFKDCLVIRLIGVVSEGVRESLKHHQLFGFVDEVGYVPHDNVGSFQRRSQLLLLLEIDSVETKGIIPGKLFEYLSAKRPILALGPEEWEAGAMVDRHKAGRYFSSDFTNKEKLKEQIKAWFAKYKEGHLPCNSSGVAKYHRRELTKKLANLLRWELS